MHKDLADLTMQDIPLLSKQTNECWMSWKCPPMERVP